MRGTSSTDNSFVLFQGAYGDWALMIEQLIGRPVRFHKLYLTDRDDDVWRAVLKAAECPAAILRKAILSPTPRTKPRT